MSLDASRLADLVDRLDTLAADLDDLGLDLLREAADGEELDRGADKAVSSARRSVYKAAEKLRGLT